MGGKPVRYFLEGKVFDHHGKLLQPHGHGRHHVHGHGRVFVNERDELLSRDKKERALLQGFSMGGKGRTGEDRHFGERFTRSEDVQDLFLAVHGELEDLDGPLGNDKKTGCFISFGKNCLPTVILAADNDFRQLIVLTVGQSLKERNAGELRGDSHDL